LTIYFFFFSNSDEPPQQQPQQEARVSSSLFNSAQTMHTPQDNSSTASTAQIQNNNNNTINDDDGVQVEPMLTPTAQLTGTLDASAGVLHDVFQSLSLDQCRDIVELSGADVTTAATFAQELAQLVNVPVASLSESQQRLLVARRADLALWRALKAVPTRTCMVRFFFFFFFFFFFSFRGLTPQLCRCVPL
jgi:hypothetical protein